VPTIVILGRGVATILISVGVIRLPPSMYLVAFYGFPGAARAE
jgi:hypothetical protein